MKPVGSRHENTHADLLIVLRADYSPCFGARKGREGIRITMPTPRYEDVQSVLQVVTYVAGTFYNLSLRAGPRTAAGADWI